jgi:hypothetical protein
VSTAETAATERVAAAASCDVGVLLSICDNGPMDGVSAENTYIEQYVAYNFTSAPIISAKVTLTSTDMVNF